MVYMQLTKSMNIAWNEVCYSLLVHTNKLPLLSIVYNSTKKKNKWSCNYKRGMWEENRYEQI